MKKHYLDILYEKRAVQQSRIDVLLKMSKEVIPEDAPKENFKDDAEKKLPEARNTILIINQLIESYLETHQKTT